MSDLKLISPAQEASLKSALVSAIEETNAGADPDMAIAKHASANGFNAEFGRRMSEAFNASKTLNHLKTTEGEKRAETFTLSDPDKVVLLMYKPELAKEASVVSAEGNTLDFNFNKYEPKAPLVKSASAVTSKINERPVPLRTVRDAQGLLEKLSHDKRSLCIDLQAYKMKTASAAKALALSFRIPGSDTFDEVEKRVVATYGSMGKQAMDFVWQLDNFPKWGEKRAEEQTTRILLMGKTTQYKQAAEYVEFLSKSADAQATLMEFEKKAEAVRAYINAQLEKVGAGGKGGPGGQSGTGAPNKTAPSDADRLLAKMGPSKPTGSNAKAELSALGGASHIVDTARIKALDPTLLSGLGIDDTNPMAGVNEAAAKQLSHSLADSGVSEDVLNSMVRAQKGQQYEDLLRSQAKDDDAGTAALFGHLMEGKVPFTPSWLTDMISDKEPNVKPLISPEHEADIRGIKMQTMANDMISNDPVLSAYAPSDVFNVINQISEIAPSLSTNPLLMKNMTARILQQGGHIDPSELQQLLKTEESSRKLAIKGY